MPKPKPLRIFLSYANADVVSARELYRYLCGKGFDVWFNEDNLVPGQNWQHEIQRALHRSDVVIACFSQTVISKDGHVQEEFRFALDQTLAMPEGSIFLIPVRLQACEVPARLSNYQWVNLFEHEGYHPLVRALKHYAVRLGCTLVDESQPERNPDAADRMDGAHIAVSDNAHGNIVIHGNGAVIHQMNKQEHAHQEQVEKQAAEDAESEKLAAQKAKQERLMPEKEPAKKVVSQKTEKEGMAREKAEKEQRASRVKMVGFLLGGLLLVSGVLYSAFWLFPAIPAATPTTMLTPKVFLTQTPLTVLTSRSTATLPPVTLTPALQTVTALAPTASPTETMPQISTPVTGNIRISEKDGMRLLSVPAGSFTMGSDGGGSNEKPAHAVTLDAFWIDETEVTNRMYTLCVAAGACKPPYNNASATHKSYYDNAQYENYPVIHVYWKDAQTYCGWAGRALPSEAQWEKAARGADEYTYPWGNDTPNSNLLNYNRPAGGDTSEVGAYPHGASPYGALDMAGNVWEWVNDWYDATYYAHAPASNPAGPGFGEAHGLRGGAWNSARASIRSFYRSSGQTGYMNIDTGFRCATSSP